MMDMVNTIAPPPTLDDAVAWLLRTMDLCATGPPYDEWKASRTTINLVETAGQGPDSPSLTYSNNTEEETRTTDTEFYRQLFFISTVLNAWISNESVQSDVLLQG
ncbi:hypothetical protein ACO1O0_008375 [Amphichorda felina]